VAQVCSVFSQLLQLFSRGVFSRGEFARAVKQHSAERNAKGFTCWGQFVAMLFCQVAQLKSLREVYMGLASCEAPLKHLGISETPRNRRWRMPTKTGPGSPGSSTTHCSINCWKNAKRR
jgi:Domain of unknown function (DUF4372)